MPGGTILIADDDTAIRTVLNQALARAGYAPRAAVALWQKMAASGGRQPPQWLSTHPAHETRIRDLQGYVQRVLPLYARAEK